MTMPTKTRAQLRRTIEIERGSPFHRRFATNPAITGASATTPSDTVNRFPSGFWNNGWLYIVSTPTGTAPQGESKRISGYSNIGTFTMESAFSASVPVGATYEILDVFTPVEVHEAINRAIAEGFPSFYDVITDETLIVEYDQMQYDLTGLSSRPWTITNVWLEKNDTILDGTVKSADSTGITDSDGSFTDVESGWKLSIYRGTGSGQLRTVTGVAGATVSITSDFDPSPDSTSYYKIWNGSEEAYDWRRMLGVRFDRKIYPTKLYLTDNLNYSNMTGLRFRLQYTTVPAELSADSDTTVVPTEYVVNKALGLLYGARAGQTNADQNRFLQMEDRYHSKADIYRERHAFRPPDISLWMEKDTNIHNAVEDNPLNW